jgi:hypothetical protein
MLALIVGGNVGVILWAPFIILVWVMVGLFIYRRFIKRPRQPRGR